MGNIRPRWVILRGLVVRYQGVKITRVVALVKLVKLVELVELVDLVTLMDSICRDRDRVAIIIELPCGRERNMLVGLVVV